ncbi:hypothetical protein CEUSTIGMA_g13302.t1 [Chlamydomonas eustigma]|uniref:Integrase catalytic domain-containing protein n=1 Tax=Chlamydomonas eustigma TaxID=1157962 RepID=A0A250XS69_9CHLO|nr:hypothetical protein CEUSTIGMA_g13302.t1 [Chlamydomonas eustigma]|eukprot:GAX85886.1 hypothetical protein CEUSTIGMA_g13302.t1 [Chlamydomonas eustigma]
MVGKASLGRLRRVGIDCGSSFSCETGGTPCAGNRLGTRGGRKGCDEGCVGRWKKEGVGGLGGSGSKLRREGVEGSGSKLRREAAAGCPAISGIQASRMVRGGCVPILVMVRQKLVISASIALSDWKSMLPDMSRVPEALKEDFMAVLEKHSAIFAYELPPGLPPNVLPCRAIPLEHGVSFSPFGAPILFLPKPDGTLRCVLDYRELNVVTIKNRHPIPRIDDIIDQFRGASVFSNLDLVSAYNQFQLQPEDQQASTFSTPQGHFEWKPEIKFLGHILSAQGVQADPQKLKVVQEWQYPKNPQNAFSQLKQALLNPHVLANPDHDLPYELISDASLTGCGAVLTQNGNPIAYFSSKFCPAEQNYTTTEQEMLGVVKALKEWRCYLEGCKSLTIITDHNPLTYFPKNVRLSGRQARWAEFLSRFQMTWKHTPGVDNPADGLSRLHGTLVKSASIVVLAALSPSLMDHVVAAYSADSRSTDEQFLNRYNLKIQKNVWYTASDKIVIPQSVISKVISASHDDKFAGHFGVSKTLELLQRHFWWPAMRSDVEQYVASCPKCQVNKSSNLSPAGLLQPLPIPDHRWDTVSLDFITGLPKSALHYDAILVCVDKLSKFVQLIPCSTTITAEHTAKIFTDHIIAHHGVPKHGVPKHLISDRDPRFTSPYWKRFCYDLGIKQLMSTAYHPETDGQTERTNRVVEEVLRNFLSDRKLSDCARICSVLYQ